MRSTHLLRSRRWCSSRKRAAGRDHTFSYSVALLQVAIALGAVAALTRRRPVWIFSAIIGVGGVVLLVYAMVPR